MWERFQIHFQILRSLQLPLVLGKPQLQIHLASEELRLRLPHWTRELV